MNFSEHVQELWILHKKFLAIYTFVIEKSENYFRGIENQGFEERGTKEFMETMKASERQTYLGYRWVIGVLFISISVLDLYFVVMISPIMTSMMADLNADLTVMGWASTIVTVISGIFQLAGVIFIEKWGVKKNFIISTAFLTAGNLICMGAGSISVLLLGRAMVGVGFGLSGALVATVIFMWFPANERPTLFSANALACNAVQFIGYNITVPMLHFFKKWQSIFGICAALSAFFLIAWIVLGREYTAGSSENENTAVKGRTDPLKGLKLAFGSIELWKLGTSSTCKTVVRYGINFYYPAFLSTVKGLSDMAASSITGVSLLSGAIGTAVGGTAAVALGRRRPIIIASNLVTLISVIGLMVFNDTAILIAMMFLFGFSHSFASPALQTSSTEVEGMTPAMASGANFMLFGFGSVLTMIIAPLLGVLENTVGLTMALLLFAGTFAVIAVISGFTVHETGPKAKATNTAE